MIFTDNSFEFSKKTIFFHQGGCTQIKDSSEQPHIIQIYLQYSLFLISIHSHANSLFTMHLMKKSSSTQPIDCSFIFTCTCSLIDLRVFKLLIILSQLALHAIPHLLNTDNLCRCSIF